MTKIYPALTGLRALAVVLVFAFHLNSTWLRGAFIGVDIFFVLSGFLISTLLLNELSLTGRIDFKKFYIRRTLRLLPAFALMLFVINIIIYFYFPELRRANAKDSLIAFLYLANWTRAFKVDLPILGHSWSLAIEEQFYLLWPLLLLIVYRHSKKLVFPLIIALIFCSSAIRIFLTIDNFIPERVYNGLDCRFDSLMYGAAFALIHHLHLQQLEKVAIRYVHWVQIVALAVLLAFFRYADWQQQWFYLWGLSAVSFAVMILLYSLIYSQPSNWLKRILSLSPMIYLGKISYGIYLWHYPILCLILKTQLGQSNHYYFYMISIVSTLIAATLSYHLVEKYFLEKREYFK